MALQLLAPACDVSELSSRQGSAAVLASTGEGTVGSPLVQTVGTTINAYSTDLYSGSLTWTDKSDSQIIVAATHTGTSTAKKVMAATVPRYWKFSDVCSVAGQAINLI